MNPMGSGRRNAVELRIRVIAAGCCSWTWYGPIPTRFGHRASKIRDRGFGSSVEHVRCGRFRAERAGRMPMLTP